MKQPTISLCIITKDGCPDLEKYFHYFDQVLIQVNGADKSYKPNLPNVTVFTDYEWENDFAKARNRLQEEVITTFWMWLDDDDSVEGLENLRPLLQICEENKLDAVYLPYDYHRNENGELEAYQWRERILRTSFPWRWAGAIHETPITQGSPNTSDNNEIKVKHKQKTQEEIRASAERNHKILLSEYSKKKKDPRIIHYLALSHMHFNEDDQALKKLVEYIGLSGWNEEKYRSWTAIASIHLKHEQYSKAISACFAAINLLPEYPEAYFIMAQAYYGLEEYEKVVSWLKIGLNKPEPETHSITSPNKRIVAMVTGAFSLMTLGKPKEAKELIDLAIKASPNNKYALENKPLIDHAYYETLAIEYVEYLAEFYSKYGGDPIKLIQFLPNAMYSDPRLMRVRQRYMPAQTWGHKSIVFFCAPTGEQWGADTLAKGMGGSEEAIVYLSRELSKQGWEVTVYNDRDEIYVDDADGGVVYKPWTLLNPNDEFNIFVAWRAPEHARDIKARFKACDLHDAIEKDRVKEAKYIDKFFVKSQYHRDLYKVLPDKKFAVISNGIKKELL